MIRIYSASYFENEHLLSNGLKTLHPLKCIETKSENEWKLDVEIDDTYAEYIEQNNVIVVDTKESSFQAFRIKNIILDKRTFQFTAYHIGFDLQNYFIEDLELTSQSGLNFVTSILGETLPSNEFTPSSDISATQSYHFVRVSAYEALQKTAELFGGYLVFNNFTVSLLSSIGVNRGVVISDGKNLQGLTKTENWDNVVTTLIATCGERVYDPIYADVSYDIPYVKTMSFESEFETEVEIEADIIEQATEYVNANKYPQMNYVVKSDIIQDVYIGDTIVVKSTYDLDTTVLAYTYDVIAERIRSVEFGNYRPTVKNIFKTYASVSEVAKNTATVNQLVIDQTNIINGLYQYGYVVVNDNEIYVVDALPKETATYVLRINLGGIGFSSTGISGTYTSAWTLDGSFNANFIQAGSLNGINMSIGSGDTIFKADSNGIYLGNSTFASAPFSVDMNGNLIATNADISGKIEANSGEIANFTISTDRLYAGTSSNYVGVSPGVSSGGDYYSIWAGNSIPSSAPFSVQRDGTLKSTSGTIGAWTLSTDRLYAGSSTTYVGISPGVSSGSSYYSFWAGNSTPSSAPFSVTRNGVFKSTSGTIGGWTLDDSKIYTGSGSTYMAIDQLYRRIYFSSSYYLEHQPDSYFPGVYCNGSLRGANVWGGTLITNSDVRPQLGNSGYLGTSNFNFYSGYTRIPITVTSDLRLKDNIKEIENGVDFILGLKPVSYMLKGEQESHFGFIAQDVKKIMDKTIGEAGLYNDPLKKPDWDVNNKEENDKPHYLSLRYEEFIAPMVQTIQSLEKRIKELENGR